MIIDPGEDIFREFVLFAQNGIRLLDIHGELIKTTEGIGEDGHGAPDHEDTGEKGYNYRSNGFFNRLQRVPVLSKVFDSKSHGDPATPLLKSYCGERIVIRLIMPADKPRNTSFTIHGYHWNSETKDPSAEISPSREPLALGGLTTLNRNTASALVPVITCTVPAP